MTVSYHRTVSIHPGYEWLYKRIRMLNTHDKKVTKYVILVMFWHDISIINSYCHLTFMILTVSLTFQLEFIFETTCPTKRKLIKSINCIAYLYLSIRIQYNINTKDISKVCMSATQVSHSSLCLSDIKP